MQREVVQELRHELFQVGRLVERWVLVLELVVLEDLGHLGVGHRPRFGLLGQAEAPKQSFVLVACFVALAALDLLVLEVVEQAVVHLRQRDHGCDPLVVGLGQELVAFEAVGSSFSFF